MSYKKIGGEDLELNNIDSRNYDSPEAPPNDLDDLADLDDFEHDHEDDYSVDDDRADIGEGLLGGKKSTGKQRQFRRKPKISLKLGLVIAFVIVVLIVGFVIRYLKTSKGWSSDVDSLGRRLQPWQRNTLDEYNLSKNGLWNSSSEPQTREYFWTISDIVGAPDGVQRKMTVINGKFPGPLIEANEGDRIIVHVKNEGADPTGMHFHGMFQKGTNFMDGVLGVTQCGIMPGHEFTYNFTLDGQYGTYWYHSHWDLQAIDGVAGPLVIHSPKEDEAYKHLYDEEMVLFVNDWYHEMGREYMPGYLFPNGENDEPVPQAGLIQGMGEFDCSKYTDRECQQLQKQIIPVEENKTYRIRIINAGAMSEIDFSIDQHKFDLIEVEGFSVEPYELQAARVANAQRYSFLVKTDKREIDEQFWLRTEFNPHCYAEMNNELDINVRAIFSYPSHTEKVKKLIAKGDPNYLVAHGDPQDVKWKDFDGTVECLELNTTMLTPKYNDPIPGRGDFVELHAAFHRQQGAIKRGVFNATTWNPAKEATLSQFLREKPLEMFADGPSKHWGPDQLTVTVNSTRTIDLVINNLDDGAHPFHLHGHKFWILDSGNSYFNFGRYDNIPDRGQVMRDTLQVDGYGWVLIRFVIDNPGIWAFHCHFAWHMEAGLSMQFLALPEELMEMQPPSGWNDMCKAALEEEKEGQKEGQTN
ncbi:YALIA101S09e04324g1_1 [Yarrowia lipolytica]|nr:Laccase-1 [Yarrowia lipolytica]SEI36027.1 YALIA101S09e04324g1_1 [Yarrowia lipolytica]VBB87449.1 Conserved hypothetical protein [Yarrowia lipolytica]